VHLKNLSKSYLAQSIISTTVQDMGAGVCKPHCVDVVIMGINLKGGKGNLTFNKNLSLKLARQLKKESVC